MEENEALLQELERIPADAMEGRYLTFFSDSQVYGVPIVNVMQIVSLPPITEVPDSPAYMKGIIDLRGSILPLIDIRIRFGREEAAYTDRTCVIVASIRELDFGFIVDAVDEVTHIAEDLISPPPRLSHDGANRFLTGIARLEEKIVLLLDLARILQEEEFAALSKAAR